VEDLPQAGAGGGKERKLIMISEIKRKLFHLLGLLYVAGIYFLPRPIFIGIMVFVLLAQILFELVRLKTPAFNTWLHTNFGDLFREEEAGQFSGMAWMAGGVLATGLLLKPPLLGATVILFLIFGDGVASLVGKKVGGPRWPRSKKTFAGSSACFLACVAVGLLMLFPEYAWRGIVVSALAVTVFEVGYIPLNDNFLVPLVASLVMRIFY